MKSIYSLEVLQRILDHWYIGQIEDVTYFENVGRNIWRHYIETTQGEFELYSYPVESKEYSEPKLNEYIQDRHSNNLEQLRQKELVHSFDRYHLLLQLTRKHQITPKQAYKNLDCVIGSKIEKAFRVYGSILQIHLNDSNVDNASVLVSYGWWSIQDYKKELSNVIVDTHRHSRQQLDEAIEIVEKDQPIIERYVLKGGLFELYLSNKMSLHFTHEGKFPAIEVHLPIRQNDLLIFEESLILYTRDLRDK